MSIDISGRQKGVRWSGTIFRSKWPEYAVLFLFFASYCVITAFHEPWFDEAQVWQIAKCASLHDLLFEVPHYEGHPAFWSLLLAIPAKPGAPFEISLKLIGLIISAASVYIILFRTRLPRLMRLVLPFTYFIFYQFGVIVRPYGLMVLLFLLLTLAFPARHIKPWRFVMLLMLLCLTGAYAILLAGGIAACYLWEILQEKGIKKTAAELLRDRRTVSLLSLLILAILLALQIMPRENTFVTSANGPNSIVMCMIIVFLTLIGECTLTTSSWFFSDNTIIQYVNINIAELICMAVLGILLWAIIIGASSKKALKYFVIPYAFLAIFAAFVYFGVHHVGVVFALLLFWAGILFQDEERFELGNAWIEKIAKTDRDKNLLRYSVLGISSACLIIPVYWSAAASILDIQNEYGYGRNYAKWIIDHDLAENTTMTTWGWGTPVTDEGEKIPNQAQLYDDVYLAGGTLTNAYFDHNTVMNLNLGHDDEAYMHYRIATWDEIKYAKEQWKQMGTPDLLQGKVRLSEIYGDEISYDDYTLVYALPNNSIWKNHIAVEYVPVYAKNDVAEEHGLESILTPGLDYYLNGFTITDEMREQYENGVPVEEILKPYLDEMFGETE